MTAPAWSEETRKLLDAWVNDPLIVAVLAEPKGLERAAAQIAAVGAALAEIERLTANERAARNLLAVMHRDGGHYVEEYGFELACKTAERVRHELVEEIDRLTAEVDEAMAERDREWVQACLFPKPPAADLTPTGAIALVLAGERKVLREIVAGLPDGPGYACAEAILAALDAREKAE